MKKISVFFVTAILMIAFMACSGAKKSEAPAEQLTGSDSIAQTVVSDSVTTTAPTLSPAEMLKNFQNYVKAYGEANNNITKDPQKFMELSGQSQKQVDDMEQIKSQLNAAQLQAYQKALGVIIKVNKGGK